MEGHFTMDCSLWSPFLTLVTFPLFIFYSHLLLDVKEMNMSWRAVVLTGTVGPYTGLCAHGPHPRWHVCTSTAFFVWLCWLLMACMLVSLVQSYTQSSVFQM